MKPITHLTVLFLLTIGLGGCYNVPKSVKPMAWIFDQMPKNAPPMFKQGWIDGCTTGLAGMTSPYFRSFYHFTQDPKLRTDPTYYKVWKDTYTFCRHYAYGILREGDVRMALPNSKPPFMETFLGTHNFLENGILNLNAAGTSGMVAEHYGETAGTGFFEQGGVMDFSGDMGFNGNTQRLELDFRPKQAIIPY